VSQISGAGVFRTWNALYRFQVPRLHHRYYGERGVSGTGYQSHILRRTITSGRVPNYLSGDRAEFNGSFQSTTTFTNGNDTPVAANFKS